MRPSDVPAGPDVPKKLKVDSAQRNFVKNVFTAEEKQDLFLFVQRGAAFRPNVVEPLVFVYSLLRANKCIRVHRAPKQVFGKRIRAPMAVKKLKMTQMLDNEICAVTH